MTRRQLEARLRALEKQALQPAAVATTAQDPRDALLARLADVRAKAEPGQPPTAAQTRAIMRAFQERVAEGERGIDACEAERKTARWAAYQRQHGR
jgi:hypothetical protein